MRNTIYYIQYTPKRAFRWLTATRRRKVLSSILSILFVLISARFVFFAGGAEAAWWSGDGTGSWTKRKQLTITNNSGDNLASGTTVAVTIDAKGLASSGKLQDDCDDLRVVYDTGSTQTELTRYVSVAGNVTCGASGAAKVHFPLQAALSAGSSDTDYYIYYGNPSATAPTSTVDAFDTADDNALLVCPFDGTTECINGDGAEDPTTESGAIRYGGAKSALKFDGFNDVDEFVQVSNSSSIQDMHSDDFTAEGWFKVDIVPTGYAGLIGKTNWNDAGWGLITTDSRSLQFKAWFSGTDINWAPAGPHFSLSTWTHIAVVYDDTSKTATIYVDGSEVDTTNAATGNASSDSALNLCIGKNNCLTSPFQGEIDEIRVSNVKRYTGNFTPSTSPFVRDEHTQLLLHFDESGDDPRNTGKAIDDSGNGNHGTITGAKYVAGLVGVDNGTSDTGNTDGGNTYAGHEGIFIEEATTNKVPNPSFEHATYNTNWTASGGTPSENTTAPYYKFGSSSYKIVLSDATNVNIYDDIDAGSTSTHTLSAYIYRGTSGSIGGTVNDGVAVLYFNGAAQTTTYTDMGGGWWRLAYTASAGSGSQNYGVTVVEDSGTLYIDGVQLEFTNYTGGPDNYATSYTDGSLGASYSWSGTENNSTSTRTEADLRYSDTNNISYSAGSASFWLEPTNKAYVCKTHGWSKFFVVGDVDGGSGGELYFSVNCHNIQIVIDGNTEVDISESNLTANNWHHVVITWDGTNVYLYIDGSSKGNNTYSSFTGGDIKIGGSDEQSADSKTSDLRIFDDDLTSAEIVDLYYSGLVAHEEAIEVDAFTEEKGQNPVAIWHFDEGYGSTANDSSTYGNHLTLDNASWETQSVGARATVERYLSFDGSTGSASRSGVLREFNFGTGSFSMGGWFRHSSSISGTDTILSRYGDTGYKVYMNSSGYICVGVDDDSTWGPDDEVCSQTTQGSLADSRWHHFEAIVDRDSSPTVARIYIDGIQANYKETLSATATVTSSELIAVGADASDGTPDYWDGDIDELIVYPYARTASQVKTDVLGGSKSSVFGAHTEDWLTDGLIGYWKMDESSWNGTTGEVTDSSGNGNDGTADCNGACTETTTAASRFSNGGIFDGSDDFVDISDAVSNGTLDNLSNFTYSAWLYQDARSTTQDVFWKGAERGLSIYSDGRIYGFAATNGTNASSTSQPSDFPLSGWHLLTSTYNNNTDRMVHIYLDGVELSSYSIQTAATGALDDDSGRGFLVGTNNKTDSYWEGRMDEVRIYNRALSPAEVQDLYEWAPGPIGYWPMDEASWTNDCSTDTVFDSSGNGNNGKSCPASTGPTTTEGGVYGKAGYFDGSDDYIDVGLGSNYDNLETYTYSSWFKTDDLTGEYRIFVSAGIWRGLRIYTLGAISAVIRTSGTNGECQTANSVISPDTWYHIAMTYDDSGDRYVRVYIDGSQVSCSGVNNQATGTISDVTSSVISLNSSGSDESGFIDDARLYNYVRTQGQIIEDMNAGHPAPGSPVGSSIGHWKFDEGYGDTAYDSGTGGNNGDIGDSGQTCPTPGDTSTTCPEWSNNGKFGKALDYETSGTTDDYVDIGDIFYSDAFTACAWVNGETLDSETRSIIVKRNSSGVTGAGNPEWELAIENQVARYNSWQTGGSTAIQLTGNTTLSTGQWYHVCSVQNGNGNTGYLYLNGKEDNSANQSAAMRDTSNRIQIGVRTNNNNNRYWDGLIDEVKVYNFALTADQVKAEYNQGSAQVFGSLSTDSNLSPSSSSLDSYCPPGQGSSCTAPVGEWLFDEKTGSNAQDTSVNGNTGTITGATFHHAEPCHSGGCLQFNGNGDYVDVGTNSSLDVSQADFSVSLWAKWTEATGNARAMINVGSFTWDYAITTGFNAAGQDKVGFAWGVNNWRYDAGSGLNDGEWHHIVATHINSGYIDTIYIDGVDTSYGNGAFTFSSNNRIGVGNYDDFNGTIDQVRVYDYVRTPAQIAWEYNRGAPVGWWKFDECSGSVANDSGSGGNNGTITPGTGTPPENTAVGTCSSGNNYEMWNDGTNGKRNGSLGFDGNDDYVSTSSVVTTLTNNYSVSAWVNWGGTNGNDQAIVFNGDQLSCDGWSLTTDSANSDNLSLLGHCTNRAQTSVALTQGVWQHVVAVRWEGTPYIYLNGRLLLTSGSANAATPTAQTIIGAMDAADTNNFNGLIDEVKIWNYPLTDEQIRDDYNSGAVRFGN